MVFSVLIKRGFSIHLIERERVCYVDSVDWIGLLLTRFQATAPPAIGHRVHTTLPTPLFWNFSACRMPPIQQNPKLKLCLVGH